MGSDLKNTVKRARLRVRLGQQVWSLYRKAAISAGISVIALVGVFLLKLQFSRMCQIFLSRGGCVPASKKKSKKKATKKKVTKKKVTKKKVARKTADHKKTGKKTTKGISKGDTVTWSSPGGASTGKVKKKITRKSKTKSHEVDASPDEPQCLVASDKSGKEAAHSPKSLKKR